MIEEYKDEYPEEIEKDTNTKLAFMQNFQSYNSDSIDYLLEHHSEYPITMVLFYDSRDYDEPIMRVLAVRLFDIFCDKNEKKFKKEEFKVGRRALSGFESALPLILENVSNLISM